MPCICLKPGLLGVWGNREEKIVFTYTCPWQRWWWRRLFPFSPCVLLWRFFHVSDTSGPGAAPARLTPQMLLGGSRHLP